MKESVNLLNQSHYVSVKCQNLVICHNCSRFQSPLHLAVLSDVSLEVLKLLLEHGADVGVDDAEGNTALHLAVEHKRPMHLKVLLINATRENFNLDVFNYEGFTPLILACLAQSYQDAHALLRHGADPNVRDLKSGRTALFHAAESYNGEL